MYNRDEFYYVNYKDLDYKYKPYFRKLLEADDLTEAQLEKTDTFDLVMKQVSEERIHHIYQKVNAFFMFNDQYDVIEHRYLRRNKAGQIVETPWEMCGRVATFISLAEPKDRASGLDKLNKWHPIFLNMLLSFKISPNTPTWSSAGIPGFGCFACLPPDQKIRTVNDGLQEIQNVNIGDHVFTSGGSFGKITRKIERKSEQDIYEFELPIIHGDNLKFTADHEMLVIKNVFDRFPYFNHRAGRKFQRSIDHQWKKETSLLYLDSLSIDSVKAQDVLKGKDAFVMPAVTNMNRVEAVDNSWIPEIKKHDHKRTDEDIIKTIPLDNEMMWVYGLYCAEGHIGSRDSLVGLTLSINEECFAEKVKRIIEERFNKKVVIQKRPEYNRIDIRCSSIDLAYMFKGMFGKLCDKKDVPNFFLSLSKEQQLAFITGLYDGDADWRDRRLTITSYNIIAKVQQMLINLQIPFSYTKEPIKEDKKDRYSLKIFKEESTYGFYDKINGLYYYIMPIEDRKRHDPIEKVYDITVESDDDYSNTFLCQHYAVHNCSVVGNGDSMEEIAKWYHDTLFMNKYGFGIGHSLHKIRPGDAPFSSSKTVTKSPLKWLNVIQEMSVGMQQGDSGRGGANLVSIPIWHPSVIEFIGYKNYPEGTDVKYKNIMKSIMNSDMSVGNKDTVIDIVDKSVPLKNFNMSVLVNDSFMEAVKEDKDWTLKFELPDHSWRQETTVKARYIWDKIVNNAYETGDPGLLFFDRINKDNHSKTVKGDIYTTNPCLVGDTLISTADGRNAIPIKELADEGLDVHVYCLDHNNNPVIRTMRNPRLTGKDQQIYKVTLDDGNSIRCTGNHKFILKDGTAKEAKDLEYGDSLSTMVKYHASIKDIFPAANSNSQDYMWVNGGQRKTLSEHRMIYEFNNSPIEKGSVIHHKDFSALNNEPSNLKAMIKKEHDQYHGDHIRGDNNPMRRFPEKNWMNDPKKQQEIREKYHIGAKRSDETKRKIGIKSKENWNKNREHMVKQLKTAINRPEVKQKLSKAARKNWIVVHKKMINEARSQDYEPKIIDGAICVKRNCEYCGSVFFPKYRFREQSYCSQSCGAKGKWQNEELRKKQSKAYKEYITNKHDNLREQQAKIYSNLKFKLERKPFKKEWVNACIKSSVSCEISRESSPFRYYKDLQEAGNNYNHKVISVILDGIEDVYNGTVDEFHNLLVGGFQSTTKNNKPKFTFIGNLQCGEQALGEWEICNLWTINLMKHVNFYHRQINWSQLRDTINVATRMADNLITQNEYPREVPELERNEKEQRRIGIDYTGLADVMYVIGFKYGTKDSYEFVNSLYRFQRDNTRLYSVSLGKSKGNFPLLRQTDLYNRDYEFSEHKNCPVCGGKVIRHTEEEFVECDKCNWSKYRYLRNLELTTQAPTGCQKLDTLVCTSDGIFELQEIGGDTPDKSQNINLGIQQEKGDIKIASEYFVNGIADTKKITLSSGLELEATPNHKYRVIKNEYEWVRSDGLQIGDLLAVPLGLYNKKDEFKFKKIEINTAERLIIKQPETTGYKINKFLGHFFADGCVHKKGIRISTNAKTNEHKAIVKLGKEVFGITPTLYDNKRNCLDVCFNSKMLLRWLEINGVLKQKSKKVEIPMPIRCSSKKSLLAFILGYFHGDGSVGVDHRWNTREYYIDTSSEKMAQQLLIIMRLLGRDCNILIHKSGFGTKMYRVKLIKTKRRDETANVTRRLRSLGFTDMTVDTVVKIEDTRRITLDLVVPDTKTYVANSVVSHNTRSRMLGVSFGLEPEFGKWYKSRVMEGKEIYNVNHVLDWYIRKHAIGCNITREELIENINGGSKEEILDNWVEAYDLKPEQHIEVQAVAQRWVSNAVSKTINFDTNATTEDISKAYILAWEKGLKGITIYRKGSHHNEVISGEETCPQCGSKNILAVEGCQQCRECAWAKCNI